MARPRKDEDLDPVRGRIEKEFWKLLKTKPLSHITVSELVKCAQCNRSTFYYYFDDVDDLAWKAVAERIPVELPKMAQAYFTGTIEDVAIDAQTMQTVEQLGLLIGRDGSSRLANLTADALKSIWIKEFHLEACADDEEVSYVQDFMASGIVAMLGRYGKASDIDSLNACMLLISNLFSKPTLAFIAAKRTEAAEAGGACRA